MSSPDELIPLSRGHGAVTASVAPRGASLRALRVGGRALVEESDAREAPLSSGIVLVPWTNRVAGARWMLGDVEQRLAVTEPAAGNAIHGLLASADYDVRRAREDATTLGARIVDAPGYPFDLDVEVDYALTVDGIDVAISVRNDGPSAAPVALGAHPYLRVGDADVDELVLTVAAAESLRLGADALPREIHAVDGTRSDLRGGVPVREVPWHLCLTGLDSADGIVAHRLAGPKGAVTLWADADFAWVQVYVTREFPGPSGPRTAVAVEPMTAPPNAFNSGTGLRWIEPGGRWRPRWGIRLERAAHPRS